MNFERTYRMYGAITAADQRQRFGNYFDFFWRAKRPAKVTVRLDTGRTNFALLSRPAKFPIQTRMLEVNPQLGTKRSFRMGVAGWRFARMKRNLGGQAAIVAVLEEWPGSAQRWLRPAR